MFRMSGPIAAVLVTVLAAAPAVAGPLPGYYDSECIGQVIEGRWSESYVNDVPGYIGNTVHAASWNGVALGTQWELVDAAIAADPVMVGNTVDGSGNGTVTWYTVYGGGVLTLTDQGDWWNPLDLGDHYTVTVTSYTHTTQVRYSGGVPVEQSTIVEMSGTFDGYYPPYEVSFLVAQALQIDEGDLAAFQAYQAVHGDFPQWLPVCEDYGQWGVAQLIQMQIVPEPATMGLLGIGLGTLMLSGLRRRRRR